eukprot:178427-Prymnesium_polylepis.1
MVRYHAAVNELIELATNAVMSPPLAGSASCSPPPWPPGAVPRSISDQPITHSPPKERRSFSQSRCGWDVRSTRRRPWRR